MNTEVITESAKEVVSESAGSETEYKYVMGLTGGAISPDFFFTVFITCLVIGIVSIIIHIIISRGRKARHLVFLDALLLGIGIANLLLSAFFFLAWIS